MEQDEENRSKSVTIKKVVDPRPMKLGPNKIMQKSPVESFMFKSQSRVQIHQL